MDKVRIRNLYKIIGIDESKLEVFIQVSKILMMYEYYISYAETFTLNHIGSPVMNTPIIEISPIR